MVLTIEQQGWVELAKQTAARYSLDPALFCALVEQESGWDTFAIRYEPDFFSRYIAPQTNISPTEARARAFSYGLTQVMGQVARESGFRGKWLTQLCSPEIGLDVGAQVFSHKLSKAGNDVRAGLLRWNGGARPAYADEVLARVVNYK